VLVGTGPAATDVFRNVDTDGLGNRIVGTFGIGAATATPWGTVLCGESAVFGTGTFERDVSDRYPERYPRWASVTEAVLPNGTQAGHRADTAGATFGLVGEKYGWVVEVAPPPPGASASAAPASRKHTALGRFRHGAIAIRCTPGRPLVVYLGEDRPSGHLRKFVSAGVVERVDDPWKPRLLERGTLHVARFEPGRGRRLGRRVGHLDSPAARHADRSGRPGRDRPGRRECPGGRARAAAAARWHRGRFRRRRRARADRRDARDHRNGPRSPRAACGGSSTRSPRTSAARSGGRARSTAENGAPAMASASATRATSGSTGDATFGSRPPPSRPSSTRSPTAPSLRASPLIESVRPGLFGANLLAVVPSRGEWAGQVVPFAIAPPRAILSGPNPVGNALLLGVRHPGRDAPSGASIERVRRDDLPMLRPDGAGVFLQSRALPNGSGSPAGDGSVDRPAPRPATVAILRRGGGSLL
jgi:secreted PhoX family phosphatase